VVYHHNVLDLVLAPRSGYEIGTEAESENESENWSKSRLKGMMDSGE
jgi:hypothetical protein